MPQELNPPLKPVTLDRDPYVTPLLRTPPKFKATAKITQERIDSLNFGPEGSITEEERHLLCDVIVRREGVLAFGPEERGLLKRDIGEPYRIPTVPHEPWQIKPIPIAAATRDAFTELVRERLRTGLYEQSCSSYSSPIFAVLKQDGKSLRIVHELQRLNSVTIRDAGLPPRVDEFVDSMAGRVCYGLVDVMGGYDQRELHPDSRPMTAFETRLGRMQLTRLPQGATNSVAVYQAQMAWILQDDLPHNVQIFIDDAGIKGPKSDYGGAVLPENPGIRQFIWEYAVTLERVLYRIESAGLTVSGKKFAVCVPALEILGHVVSKAGRSVAETKRNKVQDWPTPKNPSHILQFLGLCSYVRMFIERFAEIASPMRRLTQKGATWDWSASCEASFASLKEIVGRKIMLKDLDYDAGGIRLAVDSSEYGAGGVLSQEEDSKDRPVLYESVTFTEVESKYSQPKLELCGVTKIVRRLQHVLWGVPFELLVDAEALARMINSPSLPNAPMTRWVAYLQLFSFTVVHIAGKAFTMPDVLSRVPLKNEEGRFEEAEELDVERRLLVAKTATVDWEGEPLRQSGRYLTLEAFLTSLVCPPEAPEAVKRWIKRRSANFFVHEAQLWRRSSPIPLMVVTVWEDQERILKSLHDELGHRGEAETRRRVQARFWWPGIIRSVKTWIQHCEACQRRSNSLQREIGIPTGEDSLFSRISLDVVHIKAGKFAYLLVARDNLSGWVEARPLVKLSAEKVGQFLEEEWFARFGCIRLVTVDGGSEFRGSLMKVVKACGAKFGRVTEYYPEGAGMIERGHQPIKNALAKLCGEDGKKWQQFLPAVLLADRISTKRGTGYSPYELLFGLQPVLPVDIEMLTYLAIDWWKVKTSEELVEARTEQLLRREGTISRAVKRLRDSRKRSVRYWDQRCANRLRDPLHKGDLVLLYNRSLESQWGKLFANRWNGPYRVVSKFPGGSYQLEELDGTLLRRKAAAQHVKRFYARGSTSFDETAGSDDDVDMAEAGGDVFEDAAEEPDESTQSEEGGSDSEGSAGEEGAGTEEEPGPRRSRRLKTAEDSSLKRRVGGRTAGQ
ncbi:hypothetical protein MJO28_011227 [Puccinia striiformis f. sp. tritici]|uniref:Uncharacterized protein n=1 Tax=Puccinia striiformis f. sp. tritici TaxID=168172 RepID=A0ACC0E3I4_9BASI|nr:hypothetical protein MJO28_011227 [Puccinia striiformis f. sp. tritici]